MGEFPSPKGTPSLVDTQVLSPLPLQPAAAQRQRHLPEFEDMKRRRHHYFPCSWILSKRKQERRLLR
ncbi:unnamed protein product [Caretta caretta]